MKSILKSLIAACALWLASACPAFAGGTGSETLPDSLLNEDHVYKYLYTDRAKSEQIMAEMRRRRTLPASLVKAYR